MNITETHVNYCLICHRKLWLFANGENMEHTPEAVYAGKLILENSYAQRSDRFKEISVEGIKINWFDTKSSVVHEIKKSDKRKEAHIWQAKYYIYVLEQTGVEGVTGILEYPKERKTEEVLLSEPDREFLKELLIKIDQLIHSENCPPVINNPKCKNCSYFDFCNATE